MKRFLFLLTLTILFPATTLAQDLSTCDADTVECACPPLLSADADEIDQSDMQSSTDDCYNRCTALSFFDEYETIEGWAVTCQIGGTLTAIDQGAIGLEGTSVGEAIADYYYQSPTLGVEIPGLVFTDAYREGQSVKVNYIGDYVSAIYGWLIAAGALIAVIMIMIGGLEYSSAAGNPGRVTKAKERITRSLVGLALLFGAYSIAYLIDPNTTTFDTLSIRFIEVLEADFPNETPSSSFSPVGGSASATSSNPPAEPGVGWNNTVLMDQKDYPSTLYGDSTCSPSPEGNSIMSSGCGVVSYAMVASSYLGRTIEPTTIAEDWGQLGSCDDAGNEWGTRCKACAESDPCGSCNGTRGDAFSTSELAKSLGVRATTIGTYGKPLSAEDKASILQHLTDGDFIISNYRTKSGGGHYIALIGLDENGNIIANNPWGGTLDTWAPDNYFEVAKGFYLFDR